MYLASLFAFACQPAPQIGSNSISMKFGSRFALISPENQQNAASPQIFERVEGTTAARTAPIDRFDSDEMLSFAATCLDWAAGRIPVPTLWHDSLRKCDITPDPSKIVEATIVAHHHHRTARNEPVSASLRTGLLERKEYARSSHSAREFIQREKRTSPFSLRPCVNPASTRRTARQRDNLRCLAASVSPCPPT
jgi:hypothetical protein